MQRLLNLCNCTGFPFKPSCVPKKVPSGRENERLAKTSSSKLLQKCKQVDLCQSLQVLQVLRISHESKKCNCKDRCGINVEFKLSKLEHPC